MKYLNIHCTTKQLYFVKITTTVIGYVRKKTRIGVAGVSSTQ